MIKPSAYKAVCPKCNSSEIVLPKSDCLSPLDLPGICPKCGVLREKVRNANAFEITLANVKNAFKFKNKF